jgi:glycosyltransferase involved in cell wall biosynthesis
LGSALAQTWSDFEVTVVDDGSTDRGPQLVLATSDPRVRLVRQDNAGVSAARNRGIRESTGRYVAFLDGDDEWLPEHLATLEGLIRRFPEAGIYATSYWNLWDEGKNPARIGGVPQTPDWEGLLPSYLGAACAGDPPVWMSTVCVPRPVLDKVDLFPVGVRTGEDLDLWLRIALAHPVAFSSKLTAFYDRRASVAANRYYPEEEQLIERWRSYVGATPPPDFERYIDCKKLDVARKCLLAGNRAHAAEILASMKSGDWARQRRLMGIACRVPSWCLGAAVKLKHVLRRFR